MLVSNLPKSKGKRIRISQKKQYKDHKTSSQVKVLVAGGCNGWCVKNPPINTAELYDPATNTWTKLPDLPFPISSGKMEQLNGKPTLIAGSTQNTPGGPVTQSNLMVAYDAEKNQWDVVGKIKLPRSSHAVIQVPKNYLPTCFNT